MNRQAILLLLFLFIISCNNEIEPNLKDHYFPIEIDNKEGFVYEYKIQNDPQIYEYWYYRGIERDNQKYLQSVNYNNLGEQQQLNLEKIGNSGVLLDSLTIYNKLDENVIEAVETNVEERTVFPFFPKDSTYVYLKRINWYENDKKKNTIIQNRRFLGMHKIEIEDKIFNTALFKLDEIFESDSAGVISLQSNGYEWYAENIGLVKQEKNISGFPKRTIEFARRLTFSDFRNILIK